MDFVPSLMMVILHTMLGYLPKVVSTSFLSQVVMLQLLYTLLFESQEVERLHRVLQVYVDHQTSGINLISCLLVLVATTVLCVLVCFWRTFVKQQFGPLCTLLADLIIWMWTRLLVLRFYLFEQMSSISLC